MSDLVYKDESYQIIGICMDVHNILGGGFLEIVYKDAIEFEMRQKSIIYEREKEYDIIYKNILLPHKFFSDFTVFDKIILEVKAVDGIADEFIKRTINYLAVSKCKLGLIVNFGRDKLSYKRIVL
ncbi:MAG: NADH:ubiquinone oxidoreductase [Ignavibacteria bacterium CG1_02_37_35]|nr:MAG: NADH:ubiquinone oxidoreductase [Ignavibacteria bacterium CG1_02_37_35]